MGGKFGAKMGNSRILNSSNGMWRDALNVVAQPNDLLNFSDWILTDFFEDFECESNLEQANRLSNDGRRIEASEI